MNGRSCSTIQTGCDQSWIRLMKVMPCVASGTTATERRSGSRAHGGMPKQVCSIAARIAASMAKKMKVNEA